METDRKWIVVRIDGKIAAVSTDYRQLAAISSELAKTYQHSDASHGGAGTKKGRKTAGKKICAGCCNFERITAETVSFEEVWRLRQESRWEDLMLFGTDFQKKVWRILWKLTHTEGEPQDETSSDAGPLHSSDSREQDKGHNVRLVSYSDFAELCQNRAGVRAVAHAIGLNPISVIIPCHLVIPKESIDKMQEIQTKAEATIFKGDDLCMNSILSDSSIDFGEYSMGRRLKRELILREFR